MFLLKQVKYFLADKSTCVILCEFLNKVYYLFILIIIIIIIIIIIVIIFASSCL